LKEHEQQVIAAIQAGEDPDYDQMFDELRAAIQPEVAAMMSSEGLRVSSETGVVFDPALINTEALRWARQYSGDLVRGINDTTRGVVREATATFIETPGMTVGDLRRLLEPAFSAARSEMIAVTETTRAFSEAVNVTQRQLNRTGLQMQRQWHTANDDIVCQICGPLNEQPESVWRDKFPNGPPAHPRCRCGVGLSAMPEDALLAEGRAAAREREAMLGEMGKPLDERPPVVSAPPEPSAPPLRGYEGEAVFADIGTASGRATGDQVLINRHDWENMPAGMRRNVMAHEVVHNTVEEYILHNNDEWDIAEEALTQEVLTNRQTGEQRRLYVGGVFQIGESIAESIPIAMYEDWPEVLTEEKRDEVREWAQGVTQRAGYGWDLLKKDIARLVKDLNAQL
jgi:hypothetical protein